MQIKNLIHTIRKIEVKIERKLIIILGGGLVSTEPEIVIGNIGANIGIIGQGEATIREVADALKNNTDLKEVNGLIFKDATGKLITTPKRKEFDSLEQLDYPAYDLFEEIITEETIINIVASRSCPFRCTFCCHPSAEKYIQRSLDSIFTELDYWIDRFGTKKFVFYDELFAIKEDRVLEFCNRIKPYNLSYSLQMRVDKINQSMVDAFKDSGCRLISLGLESADNRILKSMKKNITVEQIEYALDLIYKTGLPSKGSFIFGDIEEDLESIKNTCDWYKNHLNYSIILHRIMVFPGTVLYKYALEKGIIKDKLKYLEEGCPFVNLTKLSDEVYEDALKKAFKLEQLKMARILRIENLCENGNCRVFYNCFNCTRQLLSDEINFSSGQKVFCCCGIYNWLQPNLFDLKYADEQICIESFDNVFKQLAEKKLKVAIYGAGQTGQMYLLFSPSLRKCVLKIVDENYRDYDEKIWGYKIESPSVLKNSEIDIVLAPNAANEQEITAIANKLLNEYEVDAPVV
jgi:radical SAM superfamily enzyme YgiQ (UPF0313 family)